MNESLRNTRFHRLDPRVRKDVMCALVPFPWQGVMFLSFYANGLLLQRSWTCKQKLP
jgi:hypothetical protein